MAWPVVSAAAVRMVKASSVRSSTLGTTCPGVAAGSSSWWKMVLRVEVSRPEAMDVFTAVISLTHL
jgi:hypothetical protein